MLLIGLAFRLLRSLASPRRKKTTLSPEPHPRGSLHPDRIEDATFTDISER